MILVVKICAMNYNIYCYLKGIYFFSVKLCVTICQYMKEKIFKTLTYKYVNYGLFQ